MPHVSLKMLVVGHEYSRPELAKMWGYSSYHAFARGAFTPSKTPYIILFITREKQSFLPQYNDSLEGDRLLIEGENNHATDLRLVKAESNGDQIHLLWRERHHQSFTYKGQAFLLRHELRADAPSHFEFSLRAQPV